MSTENWAPSDYPLAPYVFPPPGGQGWRKVNRDITNQLKVHKELLHVFRIVFDLDYHQGHNFEPM
jgi:hypothetical protein